MREWRRQRQREANEIVILPAEDDTAQYITGSRISAAHASPTSLPSSDPIPSATDPDTRYRTDDDSTRASLLAFAELEGKLRAKQAINSTAHSTPPPVFPAADMTTAPAAAASAPVATQPPTTATDDELMASSMDAFAALELQLAKKRLQKKQEYLEDPTTHTTESTVTTADPQPTQLTVLTAPRMPEAQECCGMSCPNCVRHTQHTLVISTPDL